MLMAHILPLIRIALYLRHRLYSELFEELPNREDYADYYKVITNPLSLSMIEVSTHMG
jgi:hypothetical protein